MNAITIRQLTDQNELDALVPLYIAMHRHHRSLVTPDILVDDDELSWTRRRSTYAGWFATGDALVLVAQRDNEVLGYAYAHLLDGPDDTYAVADRYAELYSLSVAPQARGDGIGTQLLDELDLRLHDVGITDMAVGVMCDNTDALRFYQRRGLIPVETYFWRVAGAKQ